MYFFYLVTSEALLQESFVLIPEANITPPQPNLQIKRSFIGGGVHSELWRLSDLWGTRSLNFVCHCILKYFAMVPPKTFCNPKIFCTPSQKSFYHPTPKNVWPSHPPKYFALPPLKKNIATPPSKFFSAYSLFNAAPPPPQ